MNSFLNNPLALGLAGLFAMIALIGLSILIALSEISFAAANAVHLKALADTGDRRAINFLKLRQNSGKILTVLQICLNAVGVLGGIIGDAMIGPSLAEGIEKLGFSHVLSYQIGGVIAFIFVTGLFVLFADLLPKRIAMSMPDKVALSVGWFPAWALIALYPFVIVFSHLSDWLLRLFKIPATATHQVTPEDLKAILIEGVNTGALSTDEHQMIQNVLALQYRCVPSAMTPRDEIIYLDVQKSLESQRPLVQAHPYSRYPLCSGSLDKVLGSIRSEDVLAAVVDETTPLAEKVEKTKGGLRAMRRDVLSLPESLNLWEALAQFDKNNTGFALIINEYGLVVGIITYKDILGALTQGLANPFEEQIIVKRNENSWLVEGAAPTTDVAQELEIDLSEAEELFETIGGFVTHKLRRTARKTDRVEASGCRFEVVAVDGFRITQLLVTRLSAPEIE
ncbi:HlyC/CorC family transporter [Acetobacteraceae bacterium]|nr:HlyC/CorC family transporter [Acetobacteraceae bacterium]